MKLIPKAIVDELIDTTTVHHFDAKSGNLQARSSICVFDPILTCVNLDFFLIDAQKFNLHYTCISKRIFNLLNANYLFISSFVFQKIFIFCLILVVDVPPLPQQKLNAEVFVRGSQCAWSGVDRVRYTT